MQYFELNCRLCRLWRDADGEVLAECWSDAVGDYLPASPVEVLHKGEVIPVSELPGWLRSCKRDAHHG